MIIKPSSKEPKILLLRQIRSLFGLRPRERRAISQAVGQALEDLETCFAPNCNKYFRTDEQVVFDCSHTVQYCIFLYKVSRRLSLTAGGDLSGANKVYALNKALHGVDIYHEVILPEVFTCDHPVGSVLGRARYGERFSFSQHCTVGGNKGKYPNIGSNVRLLVGATVIGDSSIGDNVIISANSFVKDSVVPSDSLVFGNSPELVIKPNPFEWAFGVNGP